MFSTISETIFSISSAASAADIAQQQWPIQSKKCKHDWAKPSEDQKSEEASLEQANWIIHPYRAKIKAHPPLLHSPTATKILLYCIHL